MPKIATRQPGDFLLSFTFVIALVLLVVNDFIFKSHLPGLISGKISDLAGPIVAALLLVAILEIALHGHRKQTWAAPWWFGIAAAAIVGTFAVIKMTSVGSTAYVSATTAVMDAARPAAELVGWQWPATTPEPVGDAWDVAIALLAVPIVTITGIAWRRAEAVHLGQGDGDSSAE